MREHRSAQLSWHHMDRTPFLSSLAFIHISFFYLSFLSLICLSFICSYVSDLLFCLFHFIFISYFFLFLFSPIKILFLFPIISYYLCVLSPFFSFSFLLYYFFFSFPFSLLPSQFGKWRLQIQPQNISPGNLFHLWIMVTCLHRLNALLTQSQWLQIGNLILPFF